MIIMKRTQIYLENEQYDYLSRESEKRGMSIAKYIRELIQKSMPKERDWEESSFWSIGEDGFTTGEVRGSLEHDRVIYKAKRKDK